MGRSSVTTPTLGTPRISPLIGVNVFFRNQQLPALRRRLDHQAGFGTACPDAAYFTVGTQKVGAFSPVPANQTDPIGTVGWRKVSRRATSLALFKVTKTWTGTAPIAPAGALTVPSYTGPANAGQPGTTSKLKRLEARAQRREVRPDRAADAALAAARPESGRPGVPSRRP